MSVVILHCSSIVHVRVQSPLLQTRLSEMYEKCTYKMIRCIHLPQHGDMCMLNLMLCKPNAQKCVIVHKYFTDVLYR